MFPKIRVPQNGWGFLMENPIKMDDLGIPLLFGNTHIDGIEVGTGYVCDLNVYVEHYVSISPFSGIQICSLVDSGRIQLYKW